MVLCRDMLKKTCLQIEAKPHKHNTNSVKCSHFMKMWKIAVDDPVIVILPCNQPAPVGLFPKKSKFLHIRPNM